MTNKTYWVVVTRENGAWLADVPELEGAHTFARNLPGLHSAVREVIAMVEDLPEGAEDSLDVRYEYRTGIPQIDRESEQLRRDRERIRLEEKELTERTAAVARVLTEDLAMSVRDVATLTGVTMQRISQVVPQRTFALKKTTKTRTPSRSVSSARTGKSSQKSALTGKSDASSKSSGRK